MQGVISPVPDSPDQVWVLMREFVERYSPKEQLLEQLGPKVGSGRGKVYTLMRLAEGPLGQSELADVIGVDRPYATVIVNQLEAEGLAERTTDPEDRRRKIVAITAAGRKAVRTAHRVLKTAPPELAALDAKALRQLGALLDRLHADARP
jgi:DNA-binding MarR family transcriptional regulator